MTGDEIELLSVPVRPRRCGREIRMVINGTDPFDAAKPDARLITLLLRARRFNATLAQGEGVPFAALAEREGVSRSYFTRLVRLSYLAPDITQAILDGAAATRFDGREAPRALTSAACLARSADRARLCLSPIWIRSTHALSTEKTRLCWDRRGIIADHIRGMGYRNMARQRYCRRLARNGKPGASLADPVAKPAAQTRAESGGSRPSKVAAGENGLSAGGKRIRTIGPAREKRSFRNASIRELHRAAYRGGRKTISPRTTVRQPAIRS